MMHWHGWLRAEITDEAVRVRVKTGARKCVNKVTGRLHSCVEGVQMSARDAAIGAARKAGSYFNAARDEK